MAPLYVVAVAAEVFGGEFPVARHDPFVHAANELDAALATVEERIQVPGHLAEIFAQRRGLRVEGGEEQPLVAVELRHRIEAPALALQFAVIGFLQIRHADQPPVIAIGPAVIGAGEGGGIAELGAAQPVAAMAANIQKGMHLARRVAHNENRVFAHVSGEKIAGLRDLALMAQKEPAARENALQLLLINIRLDEDAATDEAILGIDQPERVGFHRLSPHWFCGVRRGTRSIDPASTVTIVPVMPLALILELRNTYAPARSTGWSANCSGLPPRSRSSVPGSVNCERSSWRRTAKPRRSVMVPPGATPLTRTRGPTSTASCRIRPTTACFEAV